MRGAPRTYRKTVKKLDKRHGYEYERRFGLGRWKTVRVWFIKEASREQSYGEFLKHVEKCAGSTFVKYRNIKRSER